MRLLALAVAIPGVLVILVSAVRGPIATLAPLDHGVGVLSDFAIFRSQAERLLADRQSLDPNWLYPPAAALLFLGFGALDQTTARSIWGALQVALVVLLAFAAARPLWRLPRGLRAAGAFGLVTASLPVVHCLKWGQLSILLVLLSSFALTHWGWRSAWALGAAAAIKLYPALYAVRHALAGQWRRLFEVALASVVLGVVVPVLLLGPAAAMLAARVIRPWSIAMNARPDVAGETLGTLVEKLFAADIWRGGALLFEVSLGGRRALAMVLTALLVGTTLWVLRRRKSTDRIAAHAVILAFTLGVPPAWVHYFVILPLAQAELLGNPAARASERRWFAASFVLSCAPLLAYLVDPSMFYVSSRLGLITWSALAALAGLLQLAGREPGGSPRTAAHG